LDWVILNFDDPLRQDRASSTSRYGATNCDAVSRDVAHKGDLASEFSDAGFSTGVSLQVCFNVQLLAKNATKLLGEHHFLR